MNALSFEPDYESELFALHSEINNKIYRTGRSIPFIVVKPVKREIFAADFRDRAVIIPFGDQDYMIFIVYQRVILIYFSAKPEMVARLLCA